jgi:hypothetical protein
VFAVPHTPTVFAGPLVQSALLQHPAVATHRLVPGQILKPVLQAIAQAPPVHVAVPFEVGGVQALQPAPQKLVLVSDWQTPLQLWVPVGHAPLQAIALPMHAPLHSLEPLGQAGTHARPSHVTVPPPVGAWQAVQDVLSLGPHVATALLLTHLPAQT